MDLLGQSVFDDFDGDGLVLPAADVSLTYEENLPAGLRILVGKEFRNKGELKDVHPGYYSRKPHGLVEVGGYDDLEDLKDSVTVLLANADREPEWVDDIEAIQQRLEEIGWELGDLWWRTDMNEQACRTRLWCDNWYDENW